MNVNLDAIDDSEIRALVAGYATSLSADGTITGQPGTCRTAVAILPSVMAKWTFQSFQRTAFNSPPWPK